MRYCLRHCLDTDCVMPSAYTLDCGPPLTGVICFGEYNIPITGQCGSLSLASGPGDFSPPSTWTAPLCGDDDFLYFEDSNGASGCVPITFDPAHSCVDFTWPAWNPSDIAPNTEKSIFVLGGAPPYHWLVSGIDFSLASSHTDGLSNTLIAGPASCGAAVILVIDSCDRHTGGDVLSPEGEWILAFTCGNASGASCETEVGRFIHKSYLGASGPGIWNCPGECADLAIKWGQCTGLYCDEYGDIRNAADYIVHIKYQRWLWTC